VALALLCVTGCASTYMPRTLWSVSSTELTELWAVRAHATHEIGYLAAVEFESENEHRSFTLELFFREPDTYMLRGRGTLGATGFRARVWGDSLVLLLNRQKRGYAGLADDYADQETLEMWRLLRAALPWLTGEMELDSDRMGGAYAATRIRVVEHGGRPDTVLIDLGPDQLKIGYGRFWDGYPYWHIRSATGESDKARLTLEFRQQLYNTQMDSALFRLELPPGTGPLVD
jgi:hypothetical protein